jgi:glycosyltransferase involved in cell wall biosynthesis
MRKIIHTLPSIKNEASGPTYSVVRLCGCLLQQGSQVELLTLKSEDSQNLNYNKQFENGFGPKRLGDSPEMKRYLASQARLNQIELLHNHSLWMMPNVYPGFVARKHKIPYVVSPRGCFTEYAMSIGSRIKKIFWPILQKPSLDSVSLFHATAETEYEDIRRLGFKQPVAIIPNGIDLPVIENVKKPDEGYTLLFLSRIHPNKGLDLLLKAWCAVQNEFPKWRLLIAGPDENNHLNDLKRMSNELGLERVHFIGPIYGVDKWKLMASSDLFVLPSYSENFGMVVAESLAAGTPAIVLKGAPWRMLEDNHAGWWVEIDLPSLIACFKKSMSLSKLELHFMGQKGRELMRSSFSWDLITKKMKITYDWLRHGGDIPYWISIE